MPNFEQLDGFNDKDLSSEDRLRAIDYNQEQPKESKHQRILGFKVLALLNIKTDRKNIVESSLEASEPQNQAVEYETSERDAHNFNKLKLPEDVEFILDRLNIAGEGFIVGGAVRDTLLGKNPKDYDFTTNLDYNTVSSLFASLPHQEVGKAFGILTINLNSENYEIAQYRRDISAKNRTDTEIEFVEHIEDDLSRRDFTFNALAYNKERGIIDLFGGREDIQNKTIRFVGDASQRIKEDGLRILRAFRFASTKNFKPAKETALAIKENYSELDTISADRIGQELTKIVTGENVKATLDEMRKTKVLGKIIPEMEATYDYQQDNPNHPEGDLFTHLIETVDNTSNDPVLRYAALFHDIAKPACRTTDENGVGHYYNHAKVGAEMAQKIMTRLRLPNKLINQTTELIEKHMLLHGDIKIKTIAKYIRAMGVEQSARLVELNLADDGAKQSDCNSDCSNAQNLTQFNVEAGVKADSKSELKLKYAEALKLAQPNLNPNTLAIDGFKLKEYGYQYQAIGKMKERLVRLILDGVLDNTEESLIGYLEKKKLKDKTK